MLKKMMLLGCNLLFLSTLLVCFAFQMQFQHVSGYTALRRHATEKNQDSSTVLRQKKEETHHRIGEEVYYTDGDDVITDDAQGVDWLHDDGYYNSTYEKLKNKTEKQLEKNYFSSPSDWTNTDWIIFGILMTVFGILFTCTCFVCLIPICCPGPVKAYARMI